MTYNAMAWMQKPTCQRVKIHSKYAHETIF